MPQCLAWPATAAAPAIPAPPGPAATPAPTPAPTPPPPPGAQPEPPNSPVPPNGSIGVRGQAAQAAAGQSSVTTLILEGTEDTRTPLEQGRRIGAGYSAASLLAIPYTGHSTFGTDFSKCARAAAALFIGAGAAPAACPAKPRPEITPVIKAFPGSLKALGKRRSRRAKTVIAARLTVDDVARELDRVGHRVGGLRGGRASLRKKTIHLTGYQYIRGVRVTGLLRLTKGGLSGSLRIAGGGTVPARVDPEGFEGQGAVRGRGRGELGQRQPLESAAAGPEAVSDALVPLAGRADRPLVCEGGVAYWPAARSACRVVAHRTMATAAIAAPRRQVAFHPAAP